MDYNTRGKIRGVMGACIVALILALVAVPVGTSLFPASGVAEQSAVYGAAKKMTVKFNGNGGKAAKASKRVIIGKKYGVLPTATRSGYTFKGWYSKKSGGKRVTKNSKVSSSYKTIYAIWGAGQYTITFDGNGGTAFPKTKKVTYRSFVGTLPGGTRPEYELAGWYTARVGGTKITESSVYNKKGNMTLYAHWIVKPPLHIGDMRVYDEKSEVSWSWECGLIEDNFEASHRGYYNDDYDWSDNSSRYQMSKGDYLTFLLDSKYTTLTGTLFLLYADRNTEGNMRLKIYLDNILTYTSPVMMKNVRPIEFSMDVRNVEQVRFEIDSENTWSPNIGIDASFGQL